MATGISPGQLANLPAAAPPAGVVPNFVDPPSQNLILLILGGILTTVMIMFVAMRLYLKIKYIKKITPDDYTCAVACIGAILYYISLCFAVTIGKFGTHFWNVSAAYALSDKFLIPAWIITWISSIVLIPTKLTFFLLYLHVFRSIVALRWACWIGATITVLFYTAISIVQLVLSSPRPGESWANSFEQPRQYEDSRTAVPVSAVGLAIDIYILIIPILGIVQLQLSTKRKIGCIVVFMTGIASVLCSALGVYYRVRLNRVERNRETADVTGVTYPVLVVALVEILAGIICSCMPAFTAVVKHQIGWVEKVKNGLSTVFNSLLRGSRRSRSQQQTPPGEAYVFSANRATDKARYNAYETNSTIAEEYELGPRRIEANDFANHARYKSNSRLTE